MGAMLALSGLLALTLGGGDVSPEAINAALAQEAQRVAVIARIAPAVVCIFDEDQAGGGSGVLIDSDGYGLTNYHVVAGMMQTRSGLGGLSDGQLYPLQVLGIDVTGDVAMFRLFDNRGGADEHLRAGVSMASDTEPDAAPDGVHLSTGMPPEGVAIPREAKNDFPFAPLGDSSALRAGDPVIALGNPFVLSEDYTPTVTTGIVTGVHRYQGEGETLVYTDAIQTDAAINPGNSGGPLFDAEGRIVGINGRISAEMNKYARGRYNVGLGYAITINQIKRFIPSLRAGMLARHGTMLATVMDDVDGVIFNDMFEDAPAWNAGIRVGNKLLRFGGAEITSANQFLSIIGTYPENWPVPVTYDSFGRVVHKVVRLEPVTPPMRGPFLVRDDVNNAALERLLHNFRERAAGTSEPGRLRRWEMTATRHQTGMDDLTYRVRFEDDRVVERVQVDDAGAATRTQMLDMARGQWTEDGRPSTAATEEVLYYAGLHVLGRDLLGGGDSTKDIAGIRHAGSDAVVEIDADGGIVTERILETIAMPLFGDVQLRCGFEVDSHLPARIVVRDEPSAVEVEVIFTDYDDSGGVRWPRRSSTRSKQLGFDEQLTTLTAEWK